MKYCNPFRVAGATKPCVRVNYRRGPTATAADEA
jgi:hypothetical protein